MPVNRLYGYVPVDCANEEDLVNLLGNYICEARRIIKIYYRLPRGRKVLLNAHVCSAYADGRGDRSHKLKVCVDFAKQKTEAVFSRLNPKFMFTVVQNAVPLLVMKELSK